MRSTVFHRRVTPLALLLALSSGGPEVELPRTLAGDLYIVRGADPVDPQAKVDLLWSVGGHLGVASAFDSDDAAFLIGGHGRVHILPWLGAEARLDFQTPQTYDSGDVDVDVFAIQVSALFYVPVDWPVKPYGIAGVGIYIVDVSYSGALGYKKDTSDVEVGFHIGGGTE